jgi:hypothetical protein
VPALTDVVPSILLTRLTPPLGGIATPFQKGLPDHNVSSDPSVKSAAAAPVCRPSPRALARRRRRLRLAKRHNSLGAGLHRARYAARRIRERHTMGRVSTPLLGIDL